MNFTSKVIHFTSSFFIKVIYEHTCNSCTQWMAHTQNEWRIPVCFRFLAPHVRSLGVATQSYQTKTWTNWKPTILESVRDGTHGDRLPPTLEGQTGDDQESPLPRAETPEQKPPPPHNLTRDSWVVGGSMWIRPMWFRTPQDPV